MKDPADREIEDVVSSIRRLVSQEVGAAVTRGPARRDRLVLGPALRVGDPALEKDAVAARNGAAGHGAATGTPGTDRAATETTNAAAATRRQEPSRAADEAALLEQRIAELEAAIASDDEDWEFGASGVSGTVPPRGPGRRAAPARPAAASGAAVAPETAANTGRAGPGAPENAEEDRMRALIADIVRQELQGALGERITRNIRKLVRREISRALAVRDSQ